MRESETGQMATKKNTEAYKWEFAIGTTSRAIDEKGKVKSRRHYLIADVDGAKNVERAILFFSATVDDFFVQKTQHGAHIFSNREVSSELFICLLRGIADDSWLRIGQSRDYWFLADKRPVQLAWKVERMTLRAKNSSVVK